MHTHTDAHVQDHSSTYSFQRMQTCSNNFGTNSTHNSPNFMATQSNTTKHIPRGIRNNNPLNIRIGNVWLGEVTNPTDPSFEQFVSMKYGLRAAFVLLRRYINHYHRNTIPTIIAAWAPANENNTLAYIDHVCQISGLQPDQQLSYACRDDMCQLVLAMARVETGVSLDPRLVSQAYDLA